MKDYDHLLLEVSRWFRKVQDRHPAEMRCGTGCSRCCHGLFDISLPDALQVTAGVAELSEAERRKAIARAAVIHSRILAEAPGLEPPYLLKPSDDGLVDRIAGHNAGARCALLDDGTDACLIYTNRPLACRLEGLPMIDRRDGLFGDWCEFNFTDGINLRSEEDLQWDYYRLQEVERATTAVLSDILAGSHQEYCSVLIPSLLVDYERFWAPALRKARGVEAQPDS